MQAEATFILLPAYAPVNGMDLIRPIISRIRINIK